MTEYRASFDATVTFANGGGLAAHGFRVDVPDPGIGEAGIPVVEHLTGLGQLPPAGARFTAAPLRIEGFGTIPVRAFARRPD